MSWASVGVTDESRPFCLGRKFTFQKHLNGGEEDVRGFDVREVAGVRDDEEAGIGVAGGVEFGAAEADDVGGAVDDEDGCFDGGELGDDVETAEASPDVGVRGALEADRFDTARAQVALVADLIERAKIVRIGGEDRVVSFAAMFERVFRLYPVVFPARDPDLPGAVFFIKNDEPA